VIIIVHLFFQQDETRFSRLLDRISGNKLQTWPEFCYLRRLGSAISRMAHDFFNDDDLADPRRQPPQMEFSLLIIAGAGLFLLRLRWFQTSAVPLDDEPAIRWRWPAFRLALAMLAVGGVMGWWDTEVLYRRPVIYSCDFRAAAAATSK